MNNSESKSDFNENVENEFYKENKNKENSSFNEQDDLSSKDWYWSTISRAQANDLLHGKKDGTFLIRDSSNENDYTLTVKKDGINKMMRIIYKNGRFGFRDPPQFDSLQNLIEYHSKHSLAEYYPEMNIRLEYSLSKTDICSNLNVNSDKIDVELLSEKLKLANQEYLNLTQEYDDYHQKYKNCQDEIQKFRQSLNCFEETFAIFENQIKLNEENQKEAMAHEKSGLAKHRDNIEEQLLEIKEFRKQLEKQCEEKNSQSSILDRKINELKPLLNEKKRHREQIKAILINKNGNEKSIENILEFSSINIYPNLKNLNKPNLNENCDQGQKLNYCLIDKEFLANACSFNKNTSYFNPSANPIKGEQSDNSMASNKSITYTNDDQNEDSNYLGLESQFFEKNLSSIDAEWYVGDLSKEQVHLIMKNQPDGTFLVRNSTNKAEAPFTLTVRLNGTTKMLRILKSDYNYYGFKPDKLEFNSVVKLIEHYLIEPLIVFKPDLTIRLRFPITSEQIRNYIPNYN